MGNRIDTTEITLGLGILEIGDYSSPTGTFTAYRDVGAIKTNLIGTFTREFHVFETGRPLVVVKEEVIREHFTMAFTMAEIKVANIKSALGLPNATSSGITPTFMDGGSLAPSGDLTSSMVGVTNADQIVYGGLCDVLPVALRFTHPKACSTGKRQIIEVFKAMPTGALALPHQETDWNLTEITFTALADLTRPAGQQLMQFLDER